MQLKQFTRTQMTEDINLNYYQNRQPAIHGANSSLQSISALRGSNSVPLALYARCYPMRYRAPPINFLSLEFRPMLESKLRRALSSSNRNSCDNFFFISAKKVKRVTFYHVTN